MYVSWITIGSKRFVFFPGNSNSNFSYARIYKYRTFWWKAMRVILRKSILIWSTNRKPFRIQNRRVSQTLVKEGVTNISCEVKQRNNFIVSSIATSKLSNNPYSLLYLKSNKGSPPVCVFRQKAKCNCIQRSKLQKSTKETKCKLYLAWLMFLHQYIFF